MGEFLALAAAIFYSFSNVYAKKAEGSTNLDIGVTVTLLSNAMVGIVFIIVLIITEVELIINPKGLVYVILGGVSTNLLGRYTLYGSIRFVGPSTASAYKFFSPLITLVYGLFVLQEQLQLWAIVGIVMTISGMFYLFNLGKNTLSQNENPGNNDKKRKSFYIGSALAIASGAFFGITSVLFKIGIGIMPSALLGSAAGFITSFTIMLAYTLVKTAMKPVKVDWSIKNLKYYIVCGLTGALGSLFLLISLKLTPVAVANAIRSTTPVMTLILMWKMAPGVEKVTLQLVSGIVVVVVGTAILMFG